MRNYWREPGYWQWWWRNRLSGTTKGAILIWLAALLAFAGFASAGQLSGDPSARVLTTERLLTVVRKVKGGLVTEVQTVEGTVSAPTQTELVTVRRNGRTVVIRRPAETVTDTDTVRAPARTRIQTNVRTETQTNTVDRPTTVTQTTPGKTETVTTPGTTETVTREVTQPVSTVTETDALVIVTVTETVTVTAPPGKP